LRLLLRHESGVFLLIWLLAGGSFLHALRPWKASWYDNAWTLWVPVLIGSLVLVMLVGLISGIAPGRRRLAWQLILVGAGLDLMSSVLWNVMGVAHQAMADPVTDLLDLTVYPIAAGAGVLFFLDHGGSFRRWTAWLDLVSLGLGIGVLLWSFVLDPGQHPTGAGGVGRSMLVAHVTGIWLVMVVVAMLAMTISGWRDQFPRVTLIAGALTGFLGNMVRIAAPRYEQFGHSAWNGMVDTVIPSCLLGLAVHFEHRHGDPVNQGRPRAETSLSFLSPLLVLIVIALLFDDAGNLKGTNSMVLIVVITAGIILAGMQHRDLRFEFVGLKKALSMHHVEIGLSELVRRSTDLIMLVRPDRRLAYASPAAFDILGQSPDSLRLTPAAALLGPGNESRMTHLLDDILDRHLERVEFGTTFVDPQGLPHVVRAVASSQMDNPAIAGVVLTLHETTEEQRLEREVLDCASRERSRLSSDVHDGVGQELTGIALLLRSLDLDAERARGSLVRSLDQIEEHVNGAIRLTQRLEFGLAALPAGHGTLESMLGHLTAEARGRFGFGIGFQPAPLSCELSVAEAEHLYRIAQEAINNAARHSGCRNAWIRIERPADGITLTIEDDGCGIGNARADADADGLGMRMMRYRARILGSQLQVESVPGHGTRIIVNLPCARPLPDSESGGSI